MSLNFFARDCTLRSLNSKSAFFIPAISAFWFQPLQILGVIHFLHRRPQPGGKGGRQISIYRKNCLQSGVSKKSKILSSYKMDGPSIFWLQIILWSNILCQSIQINCKRHLVLKYSTFNLAEILQDFSILTQTGQKLNISTLNKCCIQLPT